MNRSERKQSLQYMNPSKIVNVGEIVQIQVEHDLFKIWVQFAEELKSECMFLKVEFGIRKKIGKE